MASTYPGAIDNFENPDSTDPLSNPAHAGQHSNSNDAIEAIEGTLGVNPQGVYATVAARMAVVDNAAASAAVSASAAAVSASAALVSQLDAAQSASDAEQWAVKLIDPVQGTDYSSKYNANLAAASASAASAIYAEFDTRYLGSKNTPPTLDNEGNPLIVGALYWDIPSVAMKVWTGSVWVNAADSPYSWTGPISISASSSSPALLITQTGSGDVLRLYDESGDTSPFTISSTGALLTYSTVTASTPGRFQGHGAVTQCTSITRPGSPDEGDIIYETDTDLFYGWNGTAWTSIGGGGAAYQSASPASPLTGALWVDSDDDSLSVWSGSVWVPISGASGSVAFTNYAFTASATQSNFSGLDNNGLTLSYSAGNVEVYLNGAVLTPTDDYTATSGSAISLISPTNSNDIVLVSAYEVFAVANTYTKAEVDVLVSGGAGLQDVFFLMGA